MAHRIVDTPADDAHLREVEGALHDVANTLTVVLGWLDVATEQAQRAGAVPSALDVAMAWARQGRSIALSAMGAETSEHEASLTAQELAVRTASGVEPRALEHGVTVRVVVHEQVARATVAAPLRALQVLTNLLLNSLSFAPRGSEVVLDASPSDDGRIRFVVRDDGPGFTDRQIEAGVQGLVSTRQGGSGIGLRHSYVLAERVGGALRLVRPGPGGEVELTWPQVASRPQAGLKRASSAAIDGKRILVVEDDEAVWMLLETALAVRGASLRLASNIGQVEGMLAGETFDAALVDLSPIEGQAERVLDRIRSSGDAVRVVLMSGAARAPAQEVLSRASAWVRKPFEISEIVEALTPLSTH